MTTLPASFEPGESSPSPSPLHAFRGVWRLTYPRFLTRGHLLGLAGALVALGLIASAYVGHNSAEGRYVLWISGFYSTFLVPVMAFITAGGAIRDDMTPGTVDYVLTRPVPRPAYVVFKYVAQCAVMQVEYLIALGVFVGVGAVHGTTGLLSAVPALAFAQILLVIAFSAFGFLLGSITSRYVIVGLLYGAVVEVGVGQIPTQLNRLSISHQVRLMLDYRLEALSGQSVLLQSGPETLVVTAVVLAFAIGTLAVAACIFSARELTRGGEA